MKICIFGAASAHIDEVFTKAVEELGEKLAKRGHSLVFGAGATGAMGAAARGFKRGDGKILGVIPEFFRRETIELIYEDCDEIRYTNTMAERKAIMCSEADAFIIAPGGIGTFEEFFEVLTLKQLGKHDKAMAIYNIDGYYDEMEKFIRTAISRKFISYRHMHMFRYFTDADEMTEYLENYVPEPDDNRLKIGD